MISLVTIRNAHHILGLPTDDESIEAKYEEIYEAVDERTDYYYGLFINQWHEQHPEANEVQPGEVTGRCHSQALQRAEEEMLEEYINDPIRVLRNREEDAY
ncbi:hypothetical protein CPHO_06795 [Corynebacterium phocae]|uniref:Uncharacterized protein n=1 Tax=Corynebacterium phocae TaxID=161895 RepID=A0A1L7D3C1_9CORY|nr:hypothetical protein [Corynebacterium phocae]APT92649.1 hypothetical protein CPHO_06795 [Corynebacterium phocae]KAA8723893.1 hypothetical protein F4V58_06315 [Corynebacterium phocae]